MEREQAVSCVVSDTVLISTQRLHNAIFQQSVHLKMCNGTPHDERACNCEKEFCCSYLNHQIDESLVLGADPNLAVEIPGSRIGAARKETSLYIACKKLARYESKTLLKLLEHGAKLNSMHGDLPGLSLLVIHCMDQGPDQKKKEINKENIRLFLEHGATIDIKDAQGKSPLDVAHELNMPDDIVKLLESKK